MDDAQICVFLSYETIGQRWLEVLCTKVSKLSSLLFNYTVTSQLQKKRNHKTVFSSWAHKCCLLTSIVATEELIGAPSLTVTWYEDCWNTGLLVLGPGTTVTSTIVWLYFPPWSVAWKKPTITQGPKLLFFKILTSNKKLSKMLPNNSKGRPSLKEQFFTPACSCQLLSSLDTLFLQIKLNVTFKPRE